MRKRTGKTPIFQGDKLIGYCSTVVLSMCNDGLDASYRYIIEDFEAEKVCKDCDCEMSRCAEGWEDQRKCCPDCK